MGKLGAQWLSGRVLDSILWGCRFVPHRRHCLVSLSKNINPSFLLVQPRKTRPFITERLLIGRKIKSNKNYNGKSGNGQFLVSQLSCNINANRVVFHVPYDFCTNRLLWLVARVTYRVNFWQKSKNSFSKTMLTSCFRCYGNLNIYKFIMRNVEISNFFCLVGDNWFYFYRNIHWIVLHIS